MLFKILQKIIAKIFNSRLVLHNPYINWSEVIKTKENNKIDNLRENVIMGEKSMFYEQTIIHNAQGIKSKIKIGDNTHIRSELLIFKSGGEIIVGDYCYLGHNTHIRSGESIKIGHHVFVAHGCNIIDSDSHEINHLERAEAYKSMLINGVPDHTPNVLTAPIIIEDHAWISYNVSILKGVTIGKGAIIGAGSVVTKNVEPFTMVAGNPAKFIKNIPN